MATAPCFSIGKISSGLILEFLRRKSRTKSGMHACMQRAHVIELPRVRDQFSVQWIEHFRLLRCKSYDYRSNGSQFYY